MLKVVQCKYPAVNCTRRCTMIHSESDPQNHHFYRSNSRSVFHVQPHPVIESASKGVTQHSKDIPQAQQQGPKSPVVTLTLYVSKYKVYIYIYIKSTRATCLPNYGSHSIDFINISNFHPQHMIRSYNQYIVHYPSSCCSNHHFNILFQIEMFALCQIVEKREKPKPKTCRTIILYKWSKL